MLLNSIHHSRVISRVLNKTFQNPKYLATQMSAMSTLPFKLADIGEGIAEVELMKWFVKVNRSTFYIFVLRTWITISILMNS